MISGGGHGADMAGLFCPRSNILISADHLLTDIMPILPKSLIAPDDRPIRRQLALLDRLERLPAATLVLPSHGIPFTGLHARIAAVRHRMSEDLDRLERRITQWTGIREILGATRGKDLPARQSILVGANVMSRLDHLVDQGRLHTDGAEIPGFGPA